MIDFRTPEAIVAQSAQSTTPRSVAAPGTYDEAIVVANGNLYVFQGAVGDFATAGALILPQRTAGRFDAAKGLVVRTLSGNTQMSCALYGGRPAPHPPVAVSAEAAGSTQIDMSWTAPSGVGSGEVTGYTVQRKTTAGDSWAATNVAITGTAAELTGLSAATNYDVRVRANGPGGSSAWVTLTGITTPATIAKKRAAKKRAAKK